MNTWIGLARLEAGLGHRAQADQFYQRVFRVVEQIGFGDHPVVQDWRQEYAQLAAVIAAAQPAAQDPFGLALNALLEVNSLETLEQALAQHPALLELPTLERVAAMATDAAQPDAARYLLARLTVLLERYNRVHTEQVDLAEQHRFVILHESLLLTAEVLDEDAVIGLRRSLVWALNTLGNAYAGQGDHVAAVEAYARAIDSAPENAMLYRNRAGEYLELQQWAQAEADIAQAAALDPDALRLPELREALTKRHLQSL